MYNYYYIYTLCQTVCGHRFWNEWFFNDMNFRIKCSRSVSTEVTKPLILLINMFVEPISEILYSNELRFRI